MDDAAVLALFAEADASVQLPRLGGVARADGVAIASERTWCFSHVGGEVRSGVMPTPPRALRAPLLRGFAKLGMSLAPLLGRGGAARGRDRLILVAALAAPVPLAFVSGSARTVTLAAVTLAVLFWMLRGRTLRLHGAEHRAIAAAETRNLVATWHGITRPTRFSPRCGTNFAALLIPVSVALERVWVMPPAALSPVFATLVALAVTMEIWIAAQRWLARFGRFLMLPGLALQRLTTREPELEDTRVALRALAGLLEHERASWAGSA
jgi:hypothetical protein